MSTGTENQKPDNARGGAKDAAKLDEALAKARSVPGCSGDVKHRIFDLRYTIYAVCINHR